MNSQAPIISVLFATANPPRGGSIFATE